jgi:hypothetical protein
MRFRILLAASLAAGLAGASSCAIAGTASSAFDVQVRIGTPEPPPPPPPPPPPGDFCRSLLPGSFGAMVTVVCSTGVVVEVAPSQRGNPTAAVHGGAYRFFLPVGLAEPGKPWETGAGTVTSWRVVHLEDRSYLEMTVGW